MQPTWQTTRLPCCPSLTLSCSLSFPSFSCCLFCTQRLSHHMENTHICTNTANLTPLCSQATRAAVCVCPLTTPLPPCNAQPSCHFTKMLKYQNHWNCVENVWQFINARRLTCINIFYGLQEVAERSCGEEAKGRGVEVVHVCVYVCVRHLKSWSCATYIKMRKVKQTSAAAATPAATAAAAATQRA